MTDLPLPPEEDDDALAAEYVLGVLDLADRAMAEARLRSNSQFATLVTQWQNRLADLNDGYEAVPAPNLMPQIEARLFPVAERRRGWFGAFWGMGLAATAALALVTYLALTPPAPTLTATLIADAGTAELTYQASIAGDQLTITHTSGAGADGTHSAELWIIAGDNPPVSLGVLDQTTETILLPGALAGAVLAVTLEVAGGSPTGAPQGPVISKGALTAL